MKVQDIIKTFMNLNPEEEIICVWYDKAFIEHTLDKPIPKEIWDKAVDIADNNIEDECGLIADEIEAQVIKHLETPQKVTV